jgi:hypothetical protein
MSHVCEVLHLLILSISQNVYQNFIRMHPTNWWVLPTLLPEYFVIFKMMVDNKSNIKLN